MKSQVTREKAVAARTQKLFRSRALNSTILELNRSFEFGSNSPSLKLGLYILLLGYLSLFRGFDLSATGLISRLQVEGRRAVMPSLCFCIPSGHSKYWLSLFSEGRGSRLVGQGGRSWPVYTPRPLALGHEIDLKCFFIIF